MDSMAQRVKNDYLAARLKSVQDLYAEMFFLLDRSVEEDPLTEQTGGMDLAIARLMENIGSTMQAFRGEMDEARQGGTLDPALQAALDEFEHSLGDGLRIMIERLTRRSRQLGEARDGLREKLVQLRHKRQGAQGYRGFKNSKLIDSRI